MKKIILILITLVIFGCKKEDTPKPVSRTQQTITPQQTQNAVNSIYYDFVGTWKCDNWVVDDFTQSTRRRDFIFSNQTSTLFNASLNQYNSSGSNYNQLFSNASTFVDSNYFDMQNTLIGVSYKGVMTTDSTLMVYEYVNGSNGAIDTSRFNEFKRI